MIQMEKYSHDERKSLLRNYIYYKIFEYEVNNFHAGYNYVGRYLTYYINIYNSTDLLLSTNIIVKMQKKI